MIQAAVYEGALERFAGEIEHMIDSRGLSQYKGTSTLDDVQKEIDSLVEVHSRYITTPMADMEKVVNDFKRTKIRIELLLNEKVTQKAVGLGNIAPQVPITNDPQWSAVLAHAQRSLERFTSIYDFQNLLELNATDYIRPDLCLASGISGCKKISAMAEAKHIKVIPHNPLSPISTAACVQLDASIPNFALQEYTGETEYPKNKLLTNPLKLENGYLIVPEGPGLGIDLNYESINDIPENPKVLDTPIGFDGSVKDR